MNHCIIWGCDGFRRMICIWGSLLFESWMYKLCEPDQLQYPQLLFIGGLFPSELGSSPNKVFFEGYSVSQLFDFEFLLCKQTAGSGAERLPCFESTKGFEHLDRLLSGNTHSVGLFLSPPKRWWLSHQELGAGRELRIFSEVCAYLSRFNFHDKIVGEGGISAFVVICSAVDLWPQ